MTSISCSGSPSCNVYIFNFMSVYAIVCPVSGGGDGNGGDGGGGGLLEVLSALRLPTPSTEELACLKDQIGQLETQFVNGCGVEVESTASPEVVSNL